MLAHLHEARRSIADHLATADPDRVTTAQAVEALEVFAELERLVHAGQVLYARRATEGTAWRLENHHWDVDYATCRHSTLAGLARVCHWHHGLLTYGGYVLRGEPGSWEMRGPPGGDRFETAQPFETPPFELDTG